MPSYVIPPKASIAILALPISFTDSTNSPKNSPKYIRICPLLSEFYSRLIIPRNFKKLSDEESFCTLDDEDLLVKKTNEVVIKVNLSRKLKLICEDFQYFYMDGDCYQKKWMNFTEDTNTEETDDPSILGAHIIFSNLEEATIFRKQFGGGIFLTKACYLHNLRGEMFSFDWKGETVIYDFQKDEILGQKEDLKIVNPFKDSSISSFYGVFSSELLFKFSLISFDYFVISLEHTDVKMIESVFSSRFYTSGINIFHHQMGPIVCKFEEKYFTKDADSIINEIAKKNFFFKNYLVVKDIFKYTEFTTKKIEQFNLYFLKTSNMRFLILKPKV